MCRCITCFVSSALLGGPSGFLVRHAGCGVVCCQRHCCSWCLSRAICRLPGMMHVVIRLHTPTSREMTRWGSVGPVLWYGWVGFFVASCTLPHPLRRLHSCCCDAVSSSFIRAVMVFVIFITDCATVLLSSAILVYLFNIFGCVSVCPLFGAAVKLHVTYSHHSTDLGVISSFGGAGLCCCVSAGQLLSFVVVCASCMLLSRPCVNGV